MTGSITRNQVQVTPADLGIIATVKDDAKDLGLGTDDTVEMLADALVLEAGYSHADADMIAYKFVHGVRCQKLWF